MIFIEGTRFGFVCLMTIILSVVYYVRRTKSGHILNLRRIPGIDAIDEAVGRCAEMGRPIFCCHGTGGLQGADDGPQTLAGLSVLSYVAEKSAKLGAKLWVPVRQPTIWPIAAEIVENAYRLSNRLDEYQPENVVFLSNHQHAFASNYLGLMFRERVGANIMIGAFWSESMYLLESGNREGAIQIGGTASMAQLPFFIVASDYCLIGEEIFAAGAYVSKDPIQSSTIAGEDFGRILACILMILGALLATISSDALLNLMRM